ncbi:MAG: helix-turn-helix transcriptional regulator [Candidatus Heimdallarchaeota archaeon]|nr:helix-turn-helix transcriptional regulator [Candidatus Heimdallarchaeota archaeon]MCK4770886.1 helix-turn-helix transcriptional regulator [Candidatus Heimdallarchaeota archaeon]
MSAINERETAVLGLLFDFSLYGYEIEKIIKERNMRNWTEIGFSSIYYVLKRLEEEDYVRSKNKLVRGRSRVIYSITRTGRRVLKEKINALLSENFKQISPFELGIAYMHLLDPEDAIVCLEKYLFSSQKRLDMLKELLKNSKAELANYRKIALHERPLELVDAEMNWVKRFIAELQSNREFLKGE